MSHERNSTRTEHDTMGAIEVPAERLWGAQTERSRHHFAISEERMPREVVYALALLKKACALVNVELGALDEPRASAIVAAADEILAGQHDREFPLSVWQTGSGTQTNMNVNEVIANRGSELMGGERGPKRLVHPNDHVNLGQSSNDTFPTAMSLAAYEALTRRVLPPVSALAETLSEAAGRFRDVVKIGRTHLMDATPITLGQEIGGWAQQLAHGSKHVAASLDHLAELAIGGTAVGTGLNAPPGFGVAVSKRLAELSGLPVVSAPNKFEALAESAIPENEPGSSIMPGKVNPTQSEALTMACAQVFGNDVAINIAGASGNFQLNVYKPLIIHAFLQSTRLIGDGASSFREFCAVGIRPNLVRMRENLDRSLMLVTALAPHIGYDSAARIAKKAHTDGTTLREAALALGAVTGDDFDRWVRPEAMLGPKEG